MEATIRKRSVKTLIRRTLQIPLRTFMFKIGGDRPSNVVAEVKSYKGIQVINIKTDVSIRCLMPI